jgi:hypothetical protein
MKTICNLSVRLLSERFVSDGVITNNFVSYTFVTFKKPLPKGKVDVSLCPNSEVKQ